MPPAAGLTAQIGEFPLCSAANQTTGPPSEGNYRLAACAPQKSTSDITGLSSKRFARHFQAQSFDALKLILRPFFELAEIHSLQRRKIRRDRP
jgi:hypothetical protein